MLQVQELTTQEKRKAYMKLSKKQLVEMLIENNKIIDEFVKSKPEVFDWHTKRKPFQWTGNSINFKIL